MNETATNIIFSLLDSLSHVKCVLFLLAPEWVIFDENAFNFAEIKLYANRQWHINRNIHGRSAIVYILTHVLTWRFVTSLENHDFCFVSMICVGFVCLFWPKSRNSRRNLSPHPSSVSLFLLSQVKQNPETITCTHIIVSEADNKSNVDTFHNQSTDWLNAIVLFPYLARSMDQIKLMGFCVIGDGQKSSFV